MGVKAKMNLLVTAPAKVDPCATAHKTFFPRHLLWTAAQQNLYSRRGWLICCGEGATGAGGQDLSQPHGRTDNYSGGGGFHMGGRGPGSVLVAGAGNGSCRTARVGAEFLLRQLGTSLC